MSAMPDSLAGRSERAEDRLDPWPAAALAAALGLDRAPGPGDPLPPFWHHLYARPIVEAGRTGPDGHARRGDFLPDVPGRRMWAGGRITWQRPLRIGETVERVSTVRSVTAKTGRSGPLVFAVVEHRWRGPHGPALVEEQDIVYREGAAAGQAAAAPDAAAWRRTWRCDPVLLFRYSALTYNGHRIHYDRAYATGVEGYADLVVHGPLLATLLLDLAGSRLPAAAWRRLTFRALAPAFVDRTLHAEGAPGEAGPRLWIARDDRTLAMTAELETG